MARLNQIIMLTPCVHYISPFQAFSSGHTSIENPHYHKVIQQLYGQHQYLSYQGLLLGHKEE